VGNMEVTLVATNGTLTSRILLMTDIALLVATRGDSEEFIVIAYGPRDLLDARNLHRIDQLGVFAFQITLGHQRCIIAADDAAVLFERLRDFSDYKSTFQLDSRGPRLLAQRPLDRNGSLNIICSGDPLTEEGAQNMKAEFERIPFVFNTGPRVSKEAISGAGATFQYGIRPTPNAPSTPQAIGPSSPGSDNSSPNRSVQYSPDKPVIQPGPGFGYPTHALYQSLPMTSPLRSAAEGVLASKLNELEGAIERAQMLELIASGKASPAVVQAYSRTQLTGARPPTLGRDTDMYPESPIRTSLFADGDYGPTSLSAPAMTPEQAWWANAPTPANQTPANQTPANQISANQTPGPRPFLKIPTSWFDDEVPHERPGSPTRKPFRTDFPTANLTSHGEFSDLAVVNDAYGSVPFAVSKSAAKRLSKLDGVGDAAIGGLVLTGPPKDTHGSAKRRIEANKSEKKGLESVSDTSAPFALTGAAARRMAQNRQKVNT
jgi:hypothetical protein